MKNTKFLSLILIIGLAFSTHAQGLLCSDVEPFCAGNSALTFPNSHPGVSGASNSAESGIDYSCTTGGGPNNPTDWPYPSWYFMRVDNDGDLNFSISQTQNADGSGAAFDVDFIAWGPFNDADINCGADLTPANKIDCSWLPATTEFMEIPNAQAGQIYIVMITNFSENAGFITLQQTNAGDSDSGSTDCSIVNTVDACDNETLSLDATTTGATRYEWFRDGNPLPETGPILNNVVAPSAVYLAEAYDAADVIIAVVEFNVNFVEQPIANPVTDQLICDDNNDGFWNFDLEALETTILGGQSISDFEISFHISQNNADMDAAPLPGIYTNQNPYQAETIFVRIENTANTTCYETTSFLIDVFDQPSATPFSYQLCDDDADGDDTNGLVEFNLSSIDSQLLGAQNPAQFTVSYHEDQANADAGSAPLANLYTNVIINIDQIVARVQNNDNPDCYETAIVDLVVNELPVVTNAVELVQCDDDSDGFSNFNLTESETLISNNSANEIFTYYDNLVDAETGGAGIANVTAYTNTDPSSAPDILYVRVENANSCYRVAQLDLLVQATQIPSNIEILYEECDTEDIDNSITNGVTTFDFSDAEVQIRAQAGLPTGQNLNFTFYQNEADALAELNAISDISNYRNDSSPFEQEIYVRVDGDIDNSCVGFGVHVRLRTINPTPNIDPDDILLCDDVTVGDLIETFDLTQNEAFIINGDSDVVATYHLSYTAANDGVDAIPNPASYENTNPTETIFVRVTNSMTNCYAIVDFDIVVNPLPQATVIVSDFFECENNTDFEFDFDLESKTLEILDGQDPTQFTVTYHDSQMNADNLNAPLTSPYTNMSNPQTIYAAITNNDTGCSISIINFEIEVNEGADANSDGEIILYEICDEVGDNDGSAQFDLTTLDAEIYDGQDPLDFSLTYHDSMDDAFNNVQPLPTLYENFNNPQVIYARVSNNIRPDECFEIAELTLQVNLLPIFELEDRYILCLSSNGTEAVDIPPVIDTGLSDTDYDFEWSLDGNVLPGETQSSLIPNQGGIYSVVVTDTSTSMVTMCTNTDSTEVIESEPPVLTVEVSTEAFLGNNIIESNASTTATNTTFEYNLDNGPWQDEGTFTNVTGGEHTITARDKNGCGFVSETVVVIDYPLYFTPNGDGTNETWNITGIDSQPNARIFIFDQYGKLLKELSPTGEGWDGTFNGNKMPTSDYWFRLVYDEPLTAERKEFRAHFTLKR
ncbi:T9SS type B sorting domain-containing protein [Winogradskyella ursingii]|uniref:T9SS type B sorting domain-containing protein n=1 Tax=Winogradskyella ursingii TaxID=2686079 RepID=UPI0015CE6250|nr:T9SS type B sorting domain-containing protein [Winogradskyella ursingii]